MILLEKGANYMMTPGDIENNTDLFEWADIVIMQLEIPWETVMKSAQTAKQYNCKVVLYPAPVANFKNEILKYTDIIVPNEHEAGIISGRENVTKAEAKSIAMEFARKGIKAIVTLGGEGCVEIRIS